MNVFWKSLPSELYDAKDVYGNSALLPGQRALQSLDSTLNKLKGLPAPIKDFYIRCLILKLEALITEWLVLMQRKPVKCNFAKSRFF